MVPIVDAGRVEPKVPGPGWGCSCKAWRRGEPTATDAFKALVRAALVTIEFKEQRGKCLHFEAWTEPENRYQVVYDPDNGGGWCKHCTAAMMAQFAPWGWAVEVGAADALKKIAVLEKENKRMGRELRKCQK